MDMAILGSTTGMIEEGPGHARSSGPETFPTASWRRAWSRPGAELAEIALRGERAVAVVRLLVLLVLLYFPFRSYLPPVLAAFQAGASLAAVTGSLLAVLAAAGWALSGALSIYAAVERRNGKEWIRFASALFDVTLVSGALLFAEAGILPGGGTGETALFPLYFLALGATTLRYDTRICQLAGALAVVQYAGLTLWTAARQGRPLAGFDFWAVESGRIAELILATVLFTVVVLRSRQLRLLATHDLFTGLSNRAVFDERLRQEADHSRDGFAVAMVDIDHFKRFNDTYGHPTGDQALRRVAQALRQGCRQTDVVARYGGEEFAVILPGVPYHRAFHLLERLRRTVAVTPIPVVGRQDRVAVTVSIGIASWPADGATPAEVIACADRRLYEAKQQGRDRVIGPPPAAARPLTRDEEIELEETVALRPPGM
jgi:two-component system cell cycle response regulator